MTNENQGTVADPAGDFMEALIKGVVIVALVLLLLPLAVPLLVVVLLPPVLATKARFWIVPSWQAVASVLGIIAVVALVVVEVLLALQWVQRGGVDALLAEAEWWGTAARSAVPWLIVNLAAGVLLVPVALELHRRRVSRQVRLRRIPDVTRQTQIETARKRAADVQAAHRIGVTIDPRTGRITGRKAKALSAPHMLRSGERAVGVVNRTTVRNVEERFYDVRRVRDWVDSSGRFVVLPGTASAIRFLLIAESGTGKTVFLNDAMLSALDMGCPVIFLDAKGDPADAEALAALARQLGRTAAVAPRWNLFNGTAEQITSKLMRLMPPPDGANQHYLDEIRGVLQAIQAESPVRGLVQLRDRLTQPVKYVRDAYDLGIVNAPVDRQGMTAGKRVLQALLVALRPLEPWLADDGWSYSDRPADITIVPLSPVEDAQARLGDLLMMDLRNYMSTRLAQRDKSPLLVVVDEFPQLVTDTSDPGDTAGSLYETARSAGIGLGLAAQSPAGLSNDEIRRRRALSSGAALVFGRSKDPEDVVKYAGTVMQMEASGAATGDELRSARAQHTFVIPPQDVREAADGAFWIVQGGAFAPFRALPNPTLNETEQPTEPAAAESGLSDNEQSEQPPEPPAMAAPAAVEPPPDEH